MKLIQWRITSACADGRRSSTIEYWIVENNAFRIGNATIYAQWKVKQYKLTFNANGGTVSPASKMVDYCKTCDTFPTPTWSGHTFNGWFTARSGGTKVTAPWKCIGNKTIYAQWTVKKYKISFNANGGNVSPAYIMVDYCKPYCNLPTPIRFGSEFLGWYADKSLTKPVWISTKCTGTATLYARWRTTLEVPIAW